MKFNFKPNIYCRTYKQIPLDKLLINFDYEKLKLPVFNAYIKSKDAVHALILDYDKPDTNWNELKTKLDKFNYVKYNTTSSSIDSERFRLILQLKDLVPNQILKNNTSKLTNYFGNFDLKSFDRNRWFFCPSKLNNSMNEVAIIRNDGELFDFYGEFDIQPINLEGAANHPNITTYLSIQSKMTKYAAHRLYRAIITCLFYNDLNTLNNVLDKAKHEGWYDNIINNILLKAKENLIKYEVTYESKL